MSSPHIIKTNDGYIVATEGKKDAHILKSDPNNAEIIEKIERFITARQKAGLELSDLLEAKLGLTTMSASYATLTTGAGDYDQRPNPKKK
jgi:hypothetical protein